MPSDCVYIYIHIYIYSDDVDVTYITRTMRAKAIRMIKTVLAVCGTDGECVTPVDLILSDVTSATRPSC